MTPDLRIGDEFHAAYQPRGSVVLWRVVTEPAREAGDGPWFVWCEPIHPLCGRGIPAHGVFYCRDITVIRRREVPDAR